MGDPLEELPAELCRVFLGWRLQEDRDALLALGEGALRIDLRSGECWCDDEPLPALFIAGELLREIDKTLERIGRSGPLDAGRLDALFATRSSVAGGRETLGLALTCRVEVHQGPRCYHAEARNQPAGR